MSIQPMNCSKLPALKAYLASYQHPMEPKPNGQSMYTFPNGLVLNVYDTGKVVFQGAGADTPFAEQIRDTIDQLNKPISP